MELSLKALEEAVSIRRQIDVPSKDGLPQFSAALQRG
jgi:hypothetical protein